MKLTIISFPPKFPNAMNLNKSNEKKNSNGINVKKKIFITKNVFKLLKTFSVAMKLW